MKTLSAYKKKIAKMPTLSLIPELMNEMETAVRAHERAGMYKVGTYFFERAITVRDELESRVERMPDKL